MSLRVLIVEDDADQREVLRTCLRRARALAAFKLQIDEAVDGAAGLECFRAAPFDVVIVDLLLPKLDGVALCKALRAEPRGGEAVLLAISGAFRDAHVSRRLWDESRVELLTKPLDLERFAGRLLALLGRRKESDPEGARRWLQAGEPRAAVVAPVSTPSPPPVATAAAPAPAVAASPAPALRSRGVPAPAAIALGRAWHGELGPVALAAVLVAAAEQRATGVLTLGRAKLRKIVYLEAGRPVYVDSNLRHETLGAYLVESGAITEEQLEGALRVARRDKCRLGEALLAQRVIDSAALERALAAQVQVKLAGALRWDDGQASFAPGASALQGIPRYPVETVSWVLAALERLLSADEAGSQLEAFGDSTIRLTSTGRSQVAAIVSAYGKPVVEVASSQRPLRLLLEVVGDRQRWVVRLVALLQSGLVERVDAPAAVGPSPAEAPVEATVVEAAPAAQASAPAPASALAPAPAPAEPVALAAPPAIPDALGAELLYREARAALGAGDAEAAVATLRGAVAGDPTQPDYHALLGWALFVRAGATREAAAQAAAPLAQAFALHPGSVLSHELTARIAGRLGDHRRAAEHLTAALKQAPLRLDLLGRARETLTALGDFGALERLYRTVLGAVQQGSGLDAVGLWVELALLYRDGLGRPDQARVALGVAERLAADDPRVIAARRALADAS